MIISYKFYIKYTNLAVNVSRIKKYLESYLSYFENSINKNFYITIK